MTGYQLWDFLNSFDSEALETMDLKVQVGEGESRPLLSLQMVKEITAEGNHDEIVVRVAGNKTDKAAKAKERERIGEAKKQAEKKPPRHKTDGGTGLPGESMEG